MKITKRELRQIIKEELEAVLEESFLDTVKGALGMGGEEEQQAPALEQERSNAVALVHKLYRQWNGSKEAKSLAKDMKYIENQYDSLNRATQDSHTGGITTDRAMVQSPKDAFSYSVLPPLRGESLANMQKFGVAGGVRDAFAELRSHILNEMTADSQLPDDVLEASENFTYSIGNPRNGYITLQEIVFENRDIARISDNEKNDVLAVLQAFMGTFVSSKGAIGRNLPTFTGGKVNTRRDIPVDEPGERSKSIARRFDFESGRGRSGKRVQDYEKKLDKLQR